MHNPFDNIKKKDAIQLPSGFIKVLTWLKEYVEREWSLCTIEVMTSTPNGYNLFLRNKMSFDSRTAIANFKANGAAFDATTTFSIIEPSEIQRIENEQDLIGYLSSILQEEIFTNYASIANAIYDSTAQYKGILRAGETYIDSVNDIMFGINSLDIIKQLSSKEIFEYEFTPYRKNVLSLRQYTYELNGACVSCVITSDPSSEVIKFKTLFPLNASII